MNPKPALKSSKAQFVLANLDTNMPEKGKLMILYLDEVLARQETVQENGLHSKLI